MDHTGKGLISSLKKEKGLPFSPLPAIYLKVEVV
jgi:hypothetical protein